MDPALSKRRGNRVDQHRKKVLDVQKKKTAHQSVVAKPIARWSTTAMGGRWPFYTANN